MQKLRTQTRNRRRIRRTFTSLTANLILKNTEKVSRLTFVTAISFVFSLALQLRILQVKYAKLEIALSPMQHL